ncbi:MAG: hypothetical protein OEM02_02145 [Desulfobulbaceae bacterium]|nr:hypothetical protein [Desulfobulbaceae bacterium]
MAEIKSTLELVLERAARMGKASQKDMESEEAEKKGMRFAAEFLDKKSDDITALLDTEQGEIQMKCRSGMVTGLIRNIYLARDEIQRERIKRALQGITDLSGQGGDIAAICGELENIIGQYEQHRQQVREQVENQFRMQVEQLLAQQGAQSQGNSADIDPTMHPKFAEEWTRVEGDLNSQYNTVLEQHKSQLKLRFGIK